MAFEKLRTIVITAIPKPRSRERRHDQHEDNGSDGGTDVIRDEKRRKDS